MINSKRVNEILRDCLFKKDEVEGGKVPDNAIVVEAITVKIAFNPDRIDKHREEVSCMIDKLHKTFDEGWTFLNMCFDSNDENWTSSHKDMQELLVLGIAIDRLEYCCDRDLWAILPGHMPYIRRKNNV